MTGLTEGGSGRSRRLIALVAGAALLVQGCAAATTQELRVAYDDPADACNAQRTPIIELKSTEEQDRLRNAARGAIGAAVLTAIIGVSRDDKNWLRNAAIAGAVGALSGYALTYFRQKAEQSKTQAELLASVNADARAERTLLTRTGQAVQALRNCRSSQIAALGAEIRNGAVTGDAARERALALQERARQDNALISEVLDGADERVGAYVDTTAAVSEVDSELLAAERRDQAARAAKRKVRSSSADVVASSEQLHTIREEDRMASAAAEEDLAALLELTRTS